MTSGTRVEVRALPGGFGAVEVVGLNPTVDANDSAAREICAPRCGPMR